MAVFNPIAELAAEHVTLSQLLQRHQEALVTRAWARAARLLTHCRKRLRYCIYLEEKCLLAYCLEKGIPGRWGDCISEHRRLDTMMQGAENRLSMARRRGVTSSALITLLDEEKTMKSFLERHLRREDEALAAALQPVPDAVRSEFMRARDQATRHSPAYRSA